MYISLFDVYDGHQVSYFSNVCYLRWISALHMVQDGYLVTVHLYVCLG
jgi:hypothetical protein